MPEINDTVSNTVNTFPAETSEKAWTLTTTDAINLFYTISQISC